MTDDLKERLRACQTAGGFCNPEPGVIEMTYVDDPLTTEAADRIEALEAALAASRADYTTNCRYCGRIIDKREAEDGGDSYGCQHSDGLWTCSSECSDAAYPPPNWLLEAERQPDSAGAAPAALVAELWASDAASALTNRAARSITALRAKLDQSK